MVKIQEEFMKKMLILSFVLLAQNAMAFESSYILMCAGVKGDKRITKIEYSVSPDPEDKSESILDVTSVEQAEDKSLAFMKLGKISESGDVENLTLKIHIKSPLKKEKPDSTCKIGTEYNINMSGIIGSDYRMTVTTLPVQTSVKPTIPCKPMMMKTPSPYLILCKKTASKK